MPNNNNKVNKPLLAFLWLVGLVWVNILTKEMHKKPVDPKAAVEEANMLSHIGINWLGSNGTEGVTSHGCKWKVVSRTKPRAVKIDDFLQEGEAETIMKLADGKLTRSRVVSSKNGGGKVDDVRTSEGVFLQNTGNEILKNVRKRVAQLAYVPYNHIENTQVLRYSDGQKYRMHPDFFSGKKKASLGKAGQRLATLITWLNDVPSGGETRFNSVPPLMVAPKKNSAILFYSLDPDRKEDHTSMHEALPPKNNSTKWVAVFWLRLGPLR
eukprot:TRINITY_DN5750_c0_g1_i1.p1 TRINITY_DN5750_c0_g1~~TRINITY_DN5750_c0_g1_i1.p1  ORF type:complete len:285 (+),score=40.01 TRINITY_DN5750_c0_g1_i1:54-857(+)